MRYFLLVCDRRQRKLVDQADFDDEKEALARRFERERIERGNADIEVVVLGARSRTAIERTHGRYFKSTDELLAYG